MTRVYYARAAPMRAAITVPFVVLLAVAGSGCIPVAMFPSEHRIGGGLAGGSMRGGPAEPLHETTGGQFHYRGAIAPLAMVRELWDRDFDFDVGYTLMAHEGGSFQHGPSASLSAFALRMSIDDRIRCGPDLPPDTPCAPPDFHNLFRIGVRFEGDVRFTDAEQSTAGVGGRLGLRLELSWFPAEPEPIAEVSTNSGGSSSGPSASGFVGVAYGESGVALDVLAGAGVVGQQTYGELIVALTVRIPAIAGIAIVIP